jgi:plastocyanin
MKLKVRFWILSLAMAGTLLLSACGGGGGGGGGGGASALSVTAQDTLKFDPATLSAPANGAVTITFKNGGAQQHNWVLAKNEDADKVATEAAAKNGDATGIAGVLAAGGLLAGGANEEIKFTAPAAGSYTYLCTIPGHYQAGMKGTLTTS